MRLLYHPYILEHDNPTHVENANRAKAVLDTGYKFEKVKLIENWKEYLNLVHEKKYLNRLFAKLEEAKEGLTYIDSDTYLSSGTERALQACVSMIIEGLREEKTFLLTRPPGHHAGRMGGANTFTQGFCLVNNVALASVLFEKPCVILDVDLHHGNGTEDIVKEYEHITFISLHARNIYPGTGYESYGNIMNFPLEWEIGDSAYINLLEEHIKPILEDRKPKKVFLSLGFDAHKEDPLSVLNIGMKTYEHVFKMLEEYELFCVLEGGYNTHVLDHGFKKFMEILG